MKNLIFFLSAFQTVGGIHYLPQKRVRFVSALVIQYVGGSEDYPVLLFCIPRDYIAKIRLPFEKRKVFTRFFVGNHLFHLRFGVRLPSFS